MRLPVCATKGFPETNKKYFRFTFLYSVIDDLLVVSYSEVKDK